MIRIGVLASGRGSNFESLCLAAKQEALGGELAALLTDKPGAGALDVARRHGVETEVIPPAAFPDREAHERALGDALERRGTGLVCLAGYMRLLSAGFVRRFAGKIMNIHPALLPAFPGLHAQRQALAHGAKVSGATVHFADEGCDTGPIILQAAVRVEEGDTEDTLAARILAEEHRLYPEAVRLFCAGRLERDGRIVRILPGPQAAGKAA